MGLIVFKSLVTFSFLWTLLNLYIFFFVDADDAPKWMKWSMALWVGIYLGLAVGAILLAIWVG